MSTRREVFLLHRVVGSGSGSGSLRTDPGNLRRVSRPPAPPPYITRLGDLSKTPSPLSKNGVMTPFRLSWDGTTRWRRGAQFRVGSQRRVDFHCGQVKSVVVYAEGKEGKPQTGKRGGQDFSVEP